MTRLDLERYRRQALGITTDAQRDARIEQTIRYRANDDVPGPIYAPTLWYPPGFQAGTLVAVNAPSAGLTLAVYAGKAPVATQTIIVRLRVTTALVTPTWAEIGLAFGVPVSGAGTDLTVLGVEAVSSWATVGIKNHTIPIEPVLAGDDLWVIYGAQAATMPQFRGGLADDLQSGQYLNVSGQPSTFGSMTAFAVNGATNVMPWLALTVG